MAKRIEKICLEKFRGATCPVEIGFDTSKPAVMIFGENGTGKSTIVDAMDFVCNGNIGSLEDRSIGQVRGQYLPSINSDSQDLKVTISFDGKVWEAKHSRQGASITGPNGRPTARILRRSEILNVMNAQPHERYQEIQSFLELPNIQGCEQKLRETNLNISRDLDAAARAKEQAIEALERFWKAEGSVGENHLKWAAQESKKDHGELQNTVDVLTSILMAITNAINVRNQLNTAIKNHEDAEIKRKRAEEELEKAVSEIKDDDASGPLITLLQDALQFLKGHQKTKKCPVCEHKNDVATLQERIGARLGSMHNLVKLTNNLETIKRNTSATVTISRQRQIDFINTMNILCGVVNENKNSQIAKLEVDWSKFTKAEEDGKTTTDENIVKLAHDALQIIESLQESTQSESDDVRRSLNRLNAIKGHFKTVEEKAYVASNLEKLSQTLGEMVRIVEQQRKLYVEGILDSISEEVDQMYLKVHPNENIGNIRFFLNPNRPRSLEFNGKFEDNDQIPPGAYYSESHLDTLGICIFLALAKYFNDGNTIVVLDDVVTSIDQAHMERFMNLLHEEAANFNQLIIATHYRPWRDRYRYARGPVGNIHLIELLHWSLPRGIRHTKTKISVEELQHHSQQEPLDRQIVSSKAGILLESLLDHIALIYECKISRKAEPYYTLGELTDCIGRRLRTALKSQYMAEDGSFIKSETQLGPMITRIAEMSWIRNQVGCHWNISGLDVSDSDIHQFTEATIELANALVCENCGQLPLKDRTGSYFECRCRRKRLHPVNNPD